MKHYIIKLFYCIAFTATSFISLAQSTNISDPLATLSKSQLELLEKKYGSAVIKTARSGEIAYLMLDPYTSIAMGKLKVEYIRGLNALKHNGKSISEVNREKDALKLLFYSKMRALIGEEKFAQRQDYIEHKQERIYKEEHGFTAEQIATYSHEAFKATGTPEIKNLELSPELGVMMGEMVATYKAERVRINNSGQSAQEIKSSLRLLAESHQKNVRMLIGENKYRIWKNYIDDEPRRTYARKHGLELEQISKFSIDAVKIANYKEVKYLSLSPIAALEMGEIKASYKKSVQELSKDDPERDAKRQELKKEYQLSLKQLLGKEKFADWIEYQNHSIERKYIESYGFTLEQFQKYQELENRQAVTILRIKSAAMPKDEKQRRIQEAKEGKIASLRQYLPSEQFNKWYKAYLENEAKKETAK